MEEQKRKTWIPDRVGDDSKAGFLHATVKIVAMIYFQTKPDAVFEAILKEAFTSEASEIQLLSDDGAIDSWEGLYPETFTTSLSL